MDDNNTIDNDNETKALLKGLAVTFKGTLQKRMGFILLIPTVLVGIVAVNYYYKYELLKNDPQKVVANENKELVAAVSKLIVLPEGEEPTLATVSDPDKLKDQPFFAKAKRGDKVLIYTNSRKAILYDQENNRIVEVAPINIGNPSKSSIPEPQQN
ncbi:MAG: hypothetical protein AAB461_00675 [Patescibacteria group bacterium]